MVRYPELSHNPLIDVASAADTQKDTGLPLPAEVVSGAMS